MQFVNIIELIITFTFENSCNGNGNLIEGFKQVIVINYFIW